MTYFLLVVPFALSAWVKTVNKVFLHRITTRAVMDVGAKDHIKMLSEEPTVELLIDCVTHAQQKTLIIFSYFTSISAGVLVAGQYSLSAAVPAVILVFVGIGLLGYLNALEPGELALPAWGGPNSGKITRSNLIYLSNIFTDVFLAGFIVYAHRQALASG